MALAQLQLWRPCITGFDFLIPSAFRCLSSQSLQSPSKCWQVSSLGRVCSTLGIISRGTLCPSGYRAVGIAGKLWLVHRVVKLTHHGFPPSSEAWQVHHRDGNKENNTLDNLEYVTASLNTCYSYAASLRKDRVIQCKPVLWRAVGSHEWTSCNSITSAAVQVGMRPSTISRSCRHGSFAKGYEFRFQDIQETEIDGEEWRKMLDPVSGAEVPGRSISSFGRIRSQHGHVSRGYLEQSGYYVTGILRRRVKVHRIAAFVFLGPPPSHIKNLVNHKDLDKGNNAIDNLEYVTAAENRAHFHSKARFTRTGGVKPVLSRLHGSSDGWRWHPSQHSAARNLAVNRANICHCLSGRRKQVGGYEFQLANAEEGSLPGELWLPVDMLALLQDRERRR